MKRRRGDRRRAPYECQRCGARLVLVGSGDIGVRIFKCQPCGIMDRRLPAERRLEGRIVELEGRPAGTFWPEWGYPFAVGALGVVVVVVVTVAIVRLALLVSAFVSGLGS